MRNPGVLGTYATICRSDGSGKQKRAPGAGISKHGLKRGPLPMHSDSESGDDDADFQPSSKEPTRSSNPTLAPEARASEQLAAMQRRAALLSVMSGTPTSAFVLPTAIRQPTALLPSASACFLPKFNVLEPSPLSYIPSTFSLLPSPAYRCLPPTPTTGLAPYYGPKSERDADGLDGLAELSKAAALESAQPILQDDTWRGSLVSHTGRNGVAASAHVLV